MASVRTGRHPLLWFGAVLVGVVAGVCGYLAAPLPVGGSAGHHPSPSPVIAHKPTARKSSASPTSEPTETGPPFTRKALLQTDDFLKYGWGRAVRQGIHDGVDGGLPTLCSTPAGLGKGAAEAYSAEYQGVVTHAVEVVLREPDEAAAHAKASTLAQQTDDCASMSEDIRATPGSRHLPKLPGLQDAVWWELKVPKGAAGWAHSQHGVLALARIDDRLVYLLLTSPSADPNQSTQVQPLLSQAALRLT